MHAVVPKVEPPREGVQNLSAVREQAGRAWQVAVGSPGRHAMPYAEMVADGASDDGDVFTEVLLDDGLVVAVAWIHAEERRPFAVVGGLTRDDADFVRACTDKWRRRYWSMALVAEAEGALRQRLLEAGFTEAATVRSYYWRPAGTCEPSRPAQFLDWLHDDEPLWDRLSADFDFTPSTAYRPAITEPSPSRVWNQHSRLARGTGQAP
ncbi:DUF2716 domain-containing protein [Streptomyces fildesensis]|uniref:DUF2716 domain-containing protein n=1 Tax=Streptomyces fildesensis TaxID=375757 RepID=A0ABW8CMT3_9ACTN